MNTEFLNLLKSPQEGDYGRKEKNRGDEPIQIIIIYIYNIYYIYTIYNIYYTGKCHNETPCIVILNKQKCHFVFYKKQRM
jgi:hypothetical protein